MISGEKKDVWVVKSGQLQSVTREGKYIFTRERTKALNFQNGSGKDQQASLRFIENLIWVKLLSL